MARKARFTLPGIPQHLIQRDNNREPCFYAEADYARNLTDLGQAADSQRLPHSCLRADDQPYAAARVCQICTRMK